MIQLKYASPKIALMNESQIKSWSMALLLKIHIITGWVIPTGNRLNLLEGQFKLKLEEDYGMLNPDEIEYAFRKKGTLIKDWGKDMNLNLIDQVLVPYVENRLLASANEEKRKTVMPTQRIYTDGEILNQRRWDIENAFQAMKRGYLPIIHPYFLEVLRMDEAIKAEETIADFFVRKLGEQAKHIYVKEEAK